MLIKQHSVAPDGSAFSSVALIERLGRREALRADGEVIGDAILIGVVPVYGDNWREVEITWLVDGLLGDTFSEWIDTGRPPSIDAFDTTGLLNPERALRMVRRINGDQKGVEWKPLGHRLHGRLCGTDQHPWTDRDFACGRALDVVFDWLMDTGLDAPLAIANDARIGYKP